MSTAVDRRTVLRGLGVGLTLPVLDGLEPSAAEALTPHLRARIEAASADVEPSPPRTLDSHQHETMARISELIIPATDTPGAREARVADFVDVLLTAWFPADGRKSFLKDLGRLDKRCSKRHGHVFLEASEAEQVAMLEELEREASGKRKGAPIAVGDGSRLGKVPFFDVCKWLTLVGYYTSEVGMRDELHYRTIPGSYEPCLEI